MCEVRVRDCYYFNEPPIRRPNMIKLHMNIACDNLERMSEDLEKRDEKRYNIDFSSKDARVQLNLSEDEMKQIGLYIMCNIFSKEV